MAAAAEALVSERLPINYEQRRYYDTVTWLAEVMPGAMRTPFEYQFDGQELYASDGSPLEDIFDGSIKQAEIAHGIGSFEYRRVTLEKQEYHDMIGIMRGDLPNTMVVVSDFPAELMTASKDVGGYNVSRKQTMLRVLTKTPEGTLKMYSQSLDGSDRAALEALFSHLGFRARPGELLGQRMHVNFEEPQQELLVDELMGVYDRSLAQQYGGQWYAGRRGRQRGNTYDFVCQQQDLLKAYLATTNGFTGNAADYNLAAAMEARYQAGGQILVDWFLDRPAVVAHALALVEMQEAGTVARASGKVFSGCGLTTTQESIGQTAAEQLQEAGYGEQVGSDKYGSLQFTCPKKSCSYLNTRPRGKLLERCQKCGADVRC